MEKINVVIACDGNYVPHAATCIASILTNSISTINSITLVLAGTALGQKDRLTAWAKSKFGFKLRVVAFDLNSVSGLETKGYISSATYIRYFLPTFVPDYNHVLYLDADTIVINNLHGISELITSITLKKSDYAPLYGVSDEDRDRQIPNLSKFGLLEKKYFNAGVLLLDLEYWRKSEVTSRLLELSESLRGKIGYMDQDCLNLVYQSNWREISWLYNQHGNRFDFSGAIVHFTGEKPTAIGNSHPARGLYFKYRRLSPYRFSIPEVPLERYRRELIGLRYKIQRALNKTANFFGIRRRKNPSN